MLTSQQKSEKCAASYISLCLDFLLSLRAVSDKYGQLKVAVSVLTDSAVCSVWSLFLPLGPLTSLISMILSVRLLLRRILSRTRPPASFSASTAPLCVTSLTSASFTRTMQSLTLHQKVTYSSHLTCISTVRTNDTSPLKLEC